MVKIEQKNNELCVSCTKCGYKRTATANFNWQDIDALMRLCPECFGDELVATVRRYQRDEGNPDCFCKSDNFCDQRLCKFRQLCLKLDRRP